MIPENSKILIFSGQLKKRVAELGTQITQDYKNRTKNLVVIGVLKGSFVFLADLVREMDVDLEVEFIGVRSYEGMESSGQVELTLDLSKNIVGRDVLLVEDIVDTGHTLEYLKTIFLARQPQSLKICSLLSKPAKHDLAIDYCGFDIGNNFVVGYGLDWDGRYRNLANIHEIL